MGMRMEGIWKMLYEKSSNLEKLEDRRQGRKKTDHQQI